ncbi:MAG: hypothetical protein KUG81_02715 [Gammaproteobacteria bacterium]|nr:hypothetical protein [Gammaproteobacteria bacterium]
MSNSRRGANAPSVKDDFKKHQPIAGSKKEADELRERLNKPRTPSPSLTIGGGLEKASHAIHEYKTNERINQIEAGLDRAGKKTQLKSKFNSRSKTRSRTRTRS